MIKATIPMRLPSLNEYIRACRTNVFLANNIKRKTQADIIWYVKNLPTFDKPVTIKFVWISEVGDRRDLDNIAFAKKFILDALQECGKLKNDNRKYVVGFTDEFLYGKSYEVRLEIEELKAIELEEEGKWAI